MSEMIERVAVAISAVLNAGQRPWSDCDEGWRERCREMARAAVEEMRVPTEGMLAAVSDENPDGVYDKPSLVWDDMIHAALQ